MVFFSKKARDLLPLETAVFVGKKNKYTELKWTQLTSGKILHSLPKISMVPFLGTNIVPKRKPIWNIFVSFWFFFSLPGGRIRFFHLLLSMGSKILVKLESSPQVKVKIKNLWNHHLETHHLPNSDWPWKHSLFVFRKMFQTQQSRIKGPYDFEPTDLEKIRLVAYFSCFSSRRGENIICQLFPRIGCHIP